MLSDIITDIVANEPDLDLVGTVTDRTTVGARVIENEPEVVVIGLADSELPGDYAGLFDIRPQIRLLGVLGDGRDAFLYELRPLRTPLGEVSRQTLVRAMRGGRAAGRAASD